METIERINRGYAVLLDFEKMLGYSNNKTDFIRQMCKYIVTTLGYPMVWIGSINDKNKMITHATCYYGESDNFLETSNISYNGSDIEQKLITKALETHCYQIHADVTNSSHFAIYPNENKSFGYVSTIILPLVSNNIVFGILTIHAIQSDAFNTEEAVLLEVFANLISKKLQALHSEQINNEIKLYLQKMQPLLNIVDNSSVLL